MSGKQSKKIRKSKGISKKAVAGAAAALFCAAPLAAEGGEFLVSLYPHFSFPVVKFDNALTTGFGGGLRLTYRPVKNINLFLQGDYKLYSFNTKDNIGNISIFGGTVGAGYHLPLTDRLGLDLDAGVGYYNASYEKGKGSAKTSDSFANFNVGGSISISYKIGPVVSVYASGGVEHYANGNSKFITSADVNPGLTVNITKAFSSKNNISINNQSLKPVFPVFYSWYNDNSFGNVEVCNNEDASITDVTVSFYQPQYMGQPRECGKQAVLKKGESLTVDLKAFFNEQMLSLSEKSDTMASIIVEYKYLGSKRSESFPMVVPVYGRNNMSWEDDRCASAFVSSKDPAAMWFAKYVTSTVRENIRSGVPQNLQYAMAVFQALDEFGINYVKDPTSAFEDNVGTASIDFLQFPYQTLMYRGGDCDDLSILVCSLFESIGIKTAFITIPGHIFMAFDSGLSLQEAKDYFLTLDDFIVDGDKVWVPLEITLSDEGFNKAWHKGSWEWNTANRSGAAMLYSMEDSWKTYKPVSVPGAAAKFTLPQEAAVAKGFSHTVDEFVINQITPQIAWYENLLVKAPTPQNYNDFGILYARYGLFEQAEEQFQIARTKLYLPSLLNTANLCYSKKEYESAIDWYKQVLAIDANNNLAMLGIARCAYEIGDYDECDNWYGKVYKNDRALARNYSYLGAFEQTSGRSFNLADRLEKTVWLQSTDYNLRNEKPAPLNAARPVIVQNEPEPKAEAVVDAAEPAKESLQVAMAGTVMAIVPSATKKESEVEEDEEPAVTGGDGDDKDVVPEPTAEEVPTLAVPEPVEGPAPAAEEVVAEEVEPVVETELVVETEPAVEAEPVAETEPVVEAEPVVETAPVVDAEPVVEEPAPAAEEEQAAIAVPEPVEGPSQEEITTPAVEEPTPAAEEVVAEEVETVVETEPAVEAEPVAETEPVVEAKPVVEPAPVVEEPAPAAEEEQAAIAVPEPVEGPSQEATPAQAAEEKPAVEAPAPAPEATPAPAAEEPAPAAEVPTAVVPEPVEGPALEEITTPAVEEKPAVEAPAPAPVLREPQQPLVEEPAATEEEPLQDDDDDFEYKGIVSELDFNILSVQDLADLAEETIIEHGENLDDFDSSSFIFSAREDKLVDTAPLPEKVTELLEKPIEQTSAALRQAQGPQPMVDGQIAAPATLAAAAPEEIPDINELIPAVLLPGMEEFVEKEELAQLAHNTIEMAKTIPQEEIKVSSNWVPELVEGLKELGIATKAVSELPLRQALEKPDTTAVLKPAQEPQADISVQAPQTGIATGPQTDTSVEGPQAQSNSAKKTHKIYLGFAALAAALSALFIGLKKKGKSNETL